MKFTTADGYTLTLTLAPEPHGKQWTDGDLYFLCVGTPNKWNHPAEWPVDDFGEPLDGTLGKSA